MAEFDDEYQRTLREKLVDALTLDTLEVDASAHDTADFIVDELAEHPDLAKALRATGETYSLASKGHMDLMQEAGDQGLSDEQLSDLAEAGDKVGKGHVAAENEIKKLIAEPDLARRYIDNAREVGAADQEYREVTEKIEQALNLTSEQMEALHGAITDERTLRQVRDDRVSMDARFGEEALELAQKGSPESELDTNDISSPSSTPERVGSGGGKKAGGRKGRH